MQNQRRRQRSGGSSVAKLLAEGRQVRHQQQPSQLDEELILAWADAYFQRYDRWPHSRSGLIDEDPHETWYGVDYALRHGRRGLPGGSSAQPRAASMSRS